MADFGSNGRGRSTSALSGAMSEADYLHQLALAGGREYKALAYDLLQVQPGMQVLDVGCGLGADLPELADRVGPQGKVVGIDPDPTLLAEAQQTARGRANIELERGRAEHLRFDAGAFDRVRADWVLQAIPHPRPALAEMWRVLKPGGLLSLVEPDWKAMILFPGSPAGGDDDHTLQLVLAWYQRRYPHALIGRQVYGLLQQQARREYVEVHTGALVWTSWPLANAVLRLSAAATALTEEHPALSAEITGWLQVIGLAVQHEEFLASLPLFFASAWKERYDPLAGRPAVSGPLFPG